MEHERDEALALLGAFRAGCEQLAKRWEARDDWHDASSAQELRALLAQTPMDLRGLLQLPAPDLDDRIMELTLKTLRDEIDPLKAELAAARETVFAEREVNGALRGELAEVLAERDAMQSMATQGDRAVIAVLNVFNRPEDFPDKVVVRWQYVYSGGRIVNEPEALLFETTADAEAHIEREYPWMTRIAWGAEPEATHLWGSWI